MVSVVVPRNGDGKDHFYYICGHSQSHPGRSQLSVGVPTLLYIEGVVIPRVQATVWEFPDGNGTSHRQAIGWWDGPYAYGKAHGHVGRTIVCMGTPTINVLQWE